MDGESDVEVGVGVGGEKWDAGTERQRPPFNVSRCRSVQPPKFVTSLARSNNPATAILFARTSLSARLLRRKQQIIFISKKIDDGEITHFYPFRGHLACIRDHTVAIYFSVYFSDAMKAIPREYRPAVHIETDFDRLATDLRRIGAI